MLICDIFISSTAEFQSPNFVAILHGLNLSMGLCTNGGHDSLLFIFLSLVVMMSHIPLTSMFMSFLDV